MKKLTLNQAYRELAQAYHQVSYVDVYSSLLDEEGSWQEAYTTDGLHLSVAVSGASSPSSAGDA